jgi:hypothetical protein
VVMTRWSLVDLTGRLLSFQARNPDAEPWELVELPAILFEDTEKEKSLWPEQWPLKAAKSKKRSDGPQVLERPIHATTYAGLGGVY